MIEARRSHRGDKYQLAIATHWIIQLLFEDEELEWVVVDPVVHPDRIHRVIVDDIIARYENGSHVYIQAKKNQKNRRAWSISDFASELKKACEQLENDLLGRVLFYSRTPFGEFEKFLEDSIDYETYAQFIADADNTVKKTLSELAKTIQRSEEITYNICQRIKIGDALDFDSWETRNLRDIERKFSNPALCLVIIKDLADQNQSGLEAPRHITRANLLDALRKKGLIITPYRKEEEILALFREASAIGRNSLSRNIDGHKLPRQEVGQIITYLEQGEKSILLTEGRGTGKSWILLELADILEQQQWGVLFIKGDWYEDIDSEQALFKKWNFPDDAVALAARLASYRKAVIILDSLDVLSLSKNQLALRVFLSLLDRFEQAHGVQIVAACRDFDISYDPLLQEKKWEKKVAITPFDFDSVISPILQRWGVNPEQLSQEQRDLLVVPENLKLFKPIVKRSIPFHSLTSSYHFANTFLEEIVVKNRGLGKQALTATEEMASMLMQKRRLFMPKIYFTGDQEIYQFLISNEVLQKKDGDEDAIGFTHQMIFDTLVVKDALKKNENFKEFILKYPPLPFIRPSARAYLFALRAIEPGRFTNQIKQVLSCNSIAFHLKRLVVESLAELQPISEDVPFFIWLLRNYSELFRYFLWAAKNPTWFDLFLPNIFETILEDAEFDILKLHLIAKFREWMNVRPEQIIRLWNQAVHTNHEIAQEIVFALEKFEFWNIHPIPELLERLTQIEQQNDTHFMGKILGQYVDITGKGYEMLWKWITAQIDEKPHEDLKNNLSHQLKKNLRCKYFHNDDFFKKCLCLSEQLMNLCIESLERWGQICSLNYSDSFWKISFLDDFNWPDALSDFLHGICEALKFRSQQYDSWWQRYEPILRSTRNAALMRILIEAYRINIPKNLDAITQLLYQENLLGFWGFADDVRKLFKEAFPFLSESIQEHLQYFILKCSFLSRVPKRILQERYDYLRLIPCILRIPEVQSFIEQFKENELFPIIPIYYSKGGRVCSPVSAIRILTLSDNTLIQLFKFYDHNKIGFRTFDDLPSDCIENTILGGTDSLISEFRECCSLHPLKFLPFMQRFREEKIYQQYWYAIIGGASNHLAYRFGRLQTPNEWKPIEPLPDGKRLASTLLSWFRIYPELWNDGRVIADCLEACANVLDSPSDIELLVLFFSRLSNHADPDKDADNLVYTSVRGIAASGITILAIRLMEQGQTLPELILPLLRKFAKDPINSVRISILSALPQLAHYENELGWELFDTVFKKPDNRLWEYGERFLYYQYFHHFDKVKPYLDRMKQDKAEDVGDVWGKISALAFLAGYITEDQLFNDVSNIDTESEWSGLLQVFEANINDSSVKRLCKIGILRILQTDKLPAKILHDAGSIFHALDTNDESMNFNIANQFITAFNDAKEFCNNYWFFKWLAPFSMNSSLPTLELLEHIIDKIGSIKESHIFHGEGIISAMNRIMRDAHQSDDTEFIGRVISLQDRLFKLNLPGIWNALEQAGRN